MTPRFLTQREVADELRCSVQTVRRRRDAGELPVIRAGGRVLIARADLDAYILRRREVARGAVAPPVGVTYAPGEKWWRS